MSHRKDDADDNRYSAAMGPIRNGQYLLVKKYTEKVTCQYVYVSKKMMINWIYLKSVAINIQNTS